MARVNIGLLILVAGASVAYWLLSGTALYWPTLVFAAWCALVQFALRRRRHDPQRQRARRQRLENAMIGTLCVLVLVAAVVIPLSKLLPL